MGGMERDAAHIPFVTSGSYPLRGGNAVRPFWHGLTVRALRRELLHEHLAVDTGALDDRGASRLYREIGRKNAERRSAGAPLAGLSRGTR